MQQHTTCPSCLSLCDSCESAGVPSLSCCITCKGVHFYHFQRDCNSQPVHGAAVSIPPRGQPARHPAKAATQPASQPASQPLTCPLLRDVPVLAEDATQVAATEEDSAAATPALHGCLLCKVGCYGGHQCFAPHLAHTQLILQPVCGECRQGACGDSPGRRVCVYCTEDVQATCQQRCRRAALCLYTECVARGAVHSITLHHRHASGGICCRAHWSAPVHTAVAGTCFAVCQFIPCSL